MLDRTNEIREISNQVAECQETLEKLRMTCCLAERSEKMIDLGQQVEKLGAILMETKPVNVQAIDTCIDNVGRVGAALGALYATCCTRTRERHYISMFKSLGDVHTQL